MSSKKLTNAQCSLMRKNHGQPKPPTKRTPAAADRALSPEEKLQEHLEEKRLRRAFDNNQLPATLKGYGGS